MPDSDTQRRPDPAPAQSIRSLIGGAPALLSVITMLVMIGGGLMSASHFASSLNNRLDLMQALLGQKIDVALKDSTEQRLELRRLQDDLRDLRLIVTDLKAKQEMELTDLKAKQEMELRRVIADNDWLRRQIMEMRGFAPRGPVDRNAAPEEPRQADEPREALRGGGGDGYASTGRLALPF